MRTHVYKETDGSEPKAAPRQIMSYECIQADNITCLVRPLVNLDDMLLQLLRILNPSFYFEERLFLRAQFQQSSVNVEGTEVWFDIRDRLVHLRWFGEKIIKGAPN